MSAKRPPRNGKQSLAPAVLSSANKTIEAPAELKKVLGKVYDAYQRLEDPVLNAACREDFVFHMTDWLGDLQRLSKLYDHPKSAKSVAADDVVFGFLIHALPHLMTAGRLLQGKEITRPFQYPWEK